MSLSVINKAEVMDNVASLSGHMRRCVHKDKWEDARADMEHRTLQSFLAAWSNRAAMRSPGLMCVTVQEAAVAREDSAAAAVPAEMVPARVHGPS